MSRLKFIGAMAKARADGIFDGLIKLAVQTFPDDASEAQIAVFEGKMDEFGTKIAQLETQLTQEINEANAAERSFNETLGAATIIQAELKTLAADHPQRAGKEAALGQLIADAEAMKPDVQAEKADVDDVRSMIAELTSAHQELGRKIVNARENLKRAKRNIDRSARSAERAQAKVDTAKSAAGLKQSTQTLDVALNAMNEIAKGHQEAARAAELKANSLNGAKPSSNPHIAEAMEKARGSVPQASAMSADDRLAALRAA